LARVIGIEPMLEVLETPVLPLYETPINNRLAGDKRVELFTSASKADVLTVTLIPNNKNGTKEEN
jgi:hypothetical protein